MSANLKLIKSESIEQQDQIQILDQSTLTQTLIDAIKHILGQQG